MAKIVQIEDHITVGSLAELLSLPVSTLIAELFKNGILATVNEKIDFDTAQIIVGELDLDIELAKKEHAPQAPRVKRQASKAATQRPPVVAFMGHVDHGKTSLLDAIREAKVATGEAGGITQHLSAYQVTHDGRVLTMLDTPGHEAFAALREHGARLTDVVIIVIAADDGIKPQTIEAIRFARQAGVKMIVAANKMDKPEADINRLKQQLSENELIPEDWGGDTIVMPVSAKTKDGIKELLDMILLVADVEDLRADATGPAEGLVIEAHMETGRGPVAVALVEHGMLKTGDFVSAGATYGKVRNLESTTGQPLKEAGPSTPVIITGMKALPEFGQEFSVVSSEKAARDSAAKIVSDNRGGDSTAATTSSELLRIISQTNLLTEFNIVVKADVQGSLTSVIDSLKTLNTQEVAVRIVSSGVGVIGENDIHTAATTGAIVYGFHTTMPSSIKQLASRDRVPVRLYSVIYELIDDVKQELENRLAPEVVEEVLGELEVKGIFKTTKTETICGGEVKKGKLSLPAFARLKKGKEVVADNLEVTNLKSGPSDVKEVPTGQMCGLSLKTTARIPIEEGDKLEFFNRSTKTRTL
jgi:translation initiation factor IF-2